MVQSKISLTVLGFLGLSVLAAVAWQQSHPHYPHYQPLWHAANYALSQPLSWKAEAVHAVSMTAHVHEHRSPGKPAADISLESAGLQALPLLETTPVNLILEAHLAGQVRVTLQTSPQLQLVDGASEQTFHLGDSGTLELPLSLMATSEGRHYVHLFIEHTDAAGVTTARALATEFRVGVPLVEKLSEKSLRMSNANNLVSLPGHETIY
jgi:hypothetical protein